MSLKLLVYVMQSKAADAFYLSGLWILQHLATKKKSVFGFSDFSFLSCITLRDMRSSGLAIFIQQKGQYHEKSYFLR